MGWGDRLDAILDGAADIASAPIGFIVDLAKAPISDEIGIGDPFGKYIGQAYTGLQTIGHATGDITGFNAASEWVKEHSPLEEIIGEFFKQGELLYNNEYQRALNEVPLNLDAIFPSWDPGDVSLARGLGTVAGAIAGALPGGEPLSLDIPKLWQRTDYNSPGQITVASAFGLWDLPERDREEALASGSFFFVSGLLDAGLRWYTQPEVLAGKGVRRARMRWSPDAESLIARGQRYLGLDTAVDEAAQNTAFNMKVTGARGQRVYAVVRRSEVDDSLRDRALYLMPDETEARRYAVNLNAQNPNDPPVILTINPEGLPVLLDDLSLPQQLGPDGLPASMRMITLTDRITENLDDLQLLRPEDLDLTQQIVEGAPEYLRPATHLDEALYTPDGRAIEPRDIFHAQDINNQVMGAREAYRIGGETDAVKYINHLQNAGNQSVTITDFIFKGKRTQRAINDMLGKDADYIRRVYFDDVPGGTVLATLLSQAPDYMTARTILAAAMGVRIPEAVTLSPMIQARLRNLNRDLTILQGGATEAAKANAVHRAMMDGIDMASPSYDHVIQSVEAEIAATQSQVAIAQWIETVNNQYGAFLKSPPRNTVLTSVRENIRRTDFYQQSTLARPIRMIYEKRPYRWLNMHDPQGDVQIVRQLEEARPLGITRERVRYYREKWMAATTEADKQRIYVQMDNEIITAAAKKAGLTEEQMQKAYREAAHGRRTANQILSSRRYSHDPNIDSPRWVDPDTGESVIFTMPMPLLETQLQNWFPMTDVKRLNHVASEIGRLRRKRGVTGEGLTTLLDTFYSIWKPSVLLRGGWPVRVVSDEQLRILARTGSLLYHLAAISTGEMPPWFQIFDEGLKGGQRAAGVFGIPATVGTAAAARAARAVTRGAQKLRLIDPQHYQDLVDAGLDRAISARAGFEGPNVMVNQEMEMRLGRMEQSIMDHLTSKATGNWQSIDKGNPQYGQAWQRVMNDQLGRSPIVQEFLKVLEETGDIAAAKAHLRRWFNTAEGKDIASRMPWRTNQNGGIETWIDQIDEVLDHYTIGYDPKLVASIVDRKFNQELMESIDEAFRPNTVHAEIVAQTLGEHPVLQMVNDFLSTAYDLFGRLPTDTLSRNTFYKEVFANEMKRQRRIFGLQGLDVNEEALIRGMQRTARNIARDEVMTYLYNLAEVSQFADMMRWFTPFFNAWQEVITVWGKLAIQDPSIIGRAHLLWTAPDKAGLTVTDDEGNQYIQLRLGEEMADKLGLTGWAEYMAEGGIRFGKNSFNLVLNSPLPSVGPLVQAPVNEIVKQKPELEEALKFILPYGVQANSWQVLLSPLVQRAGAWMNGPEGSRSYETHFVNVATWYDYQYRAGLIEVPATLEEIHAAARAIFTAQTFANYLAPAQPLFDSPIKPYIDIYRDLQEFYGGDADEVFLNQFGKEFISVTLSRTVSETGIPPTVNAQVARREVEDLITEYPEYGRLIIGEDAAVGEFSPAAFAWQLSNPPTSDPRFMGEAERKYRILELDPDSGRIEESDQRLGWIEYIKAMDAIEVQMRTRGLPNLRVKGAEDLANMKRALTQAIAQKYPAWWRDFNTRNELKWDQRIQAFSTISSNPLVTDRADMQGIQDYLQARRLVQAELNRRKQLGGSASMTATSNQDLVAIWETMVYSILIDNVAFSPIYYRYLEGDPVG